MRRHHGAENCWGSGLCGCARRGHKPKRRVKESFTIRNVRRSERKTPMEDIIKAIILGIVEGKKSASKKVA